jgi:hypothetical protein
MEAFTFGVFAVLVTFTAYYLFFIFSSKRQDVTWGRFLLAGPLIAVYPERYLSKQAAERIPKLVLLWLVLFVVLATCGAVLGARPTSVRSP